MIIPKKVCVLYTICFDHVIQKHIVWNEETNEIELFDDIIGCEIGVHHQTFNHDSNDIGRTLNIHHIVSGNWCIKINYNKKEIKINKY